jgi:hypothetical protein
MRIRIVVPVVATAVAASVAVYQTHPVSQLSGHAVHAPYATTEILEYLLFSAGRVVADYPALDTQKNAASFSDSQARAATESIGRCVRSIDATAGPALTDAFNAADAQRLDNALRRFDVAASRWLTASYKQNDPCPPPPPPPSAPPHDTNLPLWVNGLGVWDFVFLGWDFYGGALTIGAAGALAAVLLTMVVFVVFATAFLVPAFILYEFEHPPSDLDRQTAIAKIVRALQS